MRLRPKHIRFINYFTLSFLLSCILISLIPLTQKKVVKIFPVCVLVNAQTLKSARQTAEQWPHFLFWFSVWGESVEDNWFINNEDNGKIVKEGNKYFIQAYHTTHAQGWAIAYNATKYQDVDCEYYFTMDDDLTWALTEPGKKFLETHKMPFEIEKKTFLLLSYLKTYLPAVTVFTWPWGDNEMHNLMEINHFYKGELVQPATLFDNGCFIFQKSIVDFFIPITLGGNFTAKFINHNSYLNLFVPFLFKQNSVRFNGLKFINPGFRRHNYDSPSTYDQYLHKGVKCLWGGDLGLQQVQWNVERGKRSYDVSLRNIATFMDINHGSVRDNLYLQKKYKGNFELKNYTWKEEDCYRRISYDGE